MHVFPVGKKWHIAIQTERKVEIPTHPSKSERGIDIGVGIENFIATSSGEFHQGCDTRKYEEKKKHIQRVLSRKVKGSKNFFKTVALLSKACRKIVNVRKDHNHKLSTILSKNHAVIYMENLKLKNMTKSARGSIEEPGKNVKVKSGLNRRTLGQGIRQFTTFWCYRAYL